LLLDPQVARPLQPASLDWRKRQCLSYQVGMSQSAPHHSKAPRLFVAADLNLADLVTCTVNQVNYLRNVLRLQLGDEILLFNGRDGEWRARLSEVARSSVVLTPIERQRPQSDGPDIDYLFAPLKSARLDYMVQKATEMGVARLRPVLTRRTIVARVNLTRMHANAVEAAEQCGILRVPQIEEVQNLGKILDAWDPTRRLVLCDETADLRSPLAALAALAPGPLALLVGPEGGFVAAEREQLLAKPFVSVVSLGPRILRADTAAVAALALMNAVLGDF
jgi:16S rRNA (uracil1498-N3)-methyltransferase